MAKRYWCFSTLAGAKRTSASISEATTAGRHDAAYVSNSISIPNGSDYLQIAAPFMEGSVSIVGFLSNRFDSFQAVHSANIPLMLWLNAGANAYRLLVSATNTLQMQYWNSGTSAWVNWGGSFPAASTTLYTFIVNLTINSTFEILQGGVSVASSAVVPTNGAAAVTEVRVFSASSSAGGNVSQLMAADYDLRDSHMNSKLANAAGFYTDGTGAVADINEVNLDDGTAITLPAVGNSKTFTKTAIPAVPAGLQIAGMVVNGRGRVGGGVVADGKLRIRNGGVNTDSGNKAYIAGIEPRGHFFAADPATGTAFTEAGFNATEFGSLAA